MRLHLGGYASFFLPGFPRLVEVQLEGATPLLDVLHGLGIPDAEINLVVVNGELVDPRKVVVSQHDQVRLFTPVDGG